VTAENGQELCAGEAAEAIVLAIKQGVDWSNVVRAGLGAAPKAQVAG